MLSFVVSFLSVLIGSLLGITIGKQISKVHFINDFKELINDFVRQYDSFKNVLVQEMNNEELLEFLKIKYPKEYNKIFPIPVLIGRKRMLAFNSFQLRTMLRIKGEFIIKLQDCLEEEYSIKIDISSKGYQEFLNRLVDLRRICLDLDDY